MRPADPEDWRGVLTSTSRMVCGTPHEADDPYVLPISLPAEKVSFDLKFEKPWLSDQRVTTYQAPLLQAEKKVALFLVEETTSTAKGECGKPQTSSALILKCSVIVKNK